MKTIASDKLYIWSFILLKILMCILCGNRYITLEPASPVVAYNDMQLEINSFIIIMYMGLWIAF